MAIVLGALRVLIVLAVAATSGIGDDGPSGDAVAAVDGEEITAEGASWQLRRCRSRRLARRKSASSRGSPPSPWA
jgi:hypothetical protein